MTIDIEELAARAAIEDRLLSYTRGIDRLDPELVRAAFHPDAVLSGYSGPDMAPADFAEYAIPRLGAGYAATQHRISNIRIERDGDRAKVETYVLAYHIERGADGDVLHTFNGRYIDRFECRDGDWRIVHRTLRHDWSSKEPISAPMGGNYTNSARDRSDVIFAD